MEIKPVERPAQQIIEGFESIGTSTISDILDQMGLDCLVSGVRAVGKGFRLVGPVLTVKEISGPLGTYKTEDFQMGQLIDMAHPGDVLVFDNAGKEISTWGGLASTAAKEKGIKGVIIDGGSRDADEVVALDFPVFSRHVTPRAARTRIKMVEMNGVIQCGGIRVRPGDIAVADPTGIIIVPKEKAEEVLEEARRMEAVEKHFVEELKKGKTFGEMHRKTGTL